MLLIIFINSGYLFIFKGSKKEIEFQPGIEYFFMMIVLQAPITFKKPRKYFIYKIGC